MTTDTRGIELILLVWYCTAYPTQAFIIISVILITIVLLTIAIAIYEKLTQTTR
jgi:hypothetical protein